MSQRCAYTVILLLFSLLVHDSNYQGNAWKQEQV